jgi:hypothetical protein
MTVPTTLIPEVRLDEASLLDEARERTGLSDFGDASFREPLAKAPRAIEREARLTPAGRAGQRTRIVGLLSARLQMQAWIARHPEIEDERVDVRIRRRGLPADRHDAAPAHPRADPRCSWLAWWECRIRRRCRAGRWSRRGASAIRGSRWRKPRSRR